MKEHKKIILSSVGVVLVMALMFFFLISPRKGQLAEAREQVDAAEAETVVLETELTRLEGLQAQAPQLQAALDEIRDMVPDEDRVSSFVFQLQQEANKAGLEFVSITPQLPKPPPEGAPLAEVKIDIGARGTYFTIQDFIRRVTELDRAVRVDGFSMAAVEEEGSDEPLIELTASARVFFEQSVAGAGTQTAAGATTTTAPAPAPSTDASPAPTESPTSTPAP
ncbi:MAG: type 4a pilus biogenesis protein PilO [Actinobacteria bacterium]|nr:type 4a pilus biogenesis protein PilO [Actinomycetota bacterium]